MSDTVKTPIASHRRPNYLLILGILTALTAIEVYLAYITGPWRNPVLLAASFLKVVLVAAYYMHLRYDSRWYLLIFMVPFVFVIAIMLVIRE